jgi:hypothetical protein
MNQRSVVITLAALMCVFSAGMFFATVPTAQDAFGKLAFGTLTVLAAFIQQPQK